MEPIVDSFILHPAILIASGFDSISSRQARFLNAHRTHFYSKVIDMSETLVISRSDFELGGIMNPFGHFLDLDKSYKKVSDMLRNFPYLTRKEVFNHFYREDIEVIWKALQIELYINLSQFCIDKKRSRDYFYPSTQIIHELSHYPIYQKITALHACGLGSKLSEAFAFVFSRFKKYEELADEPVVLEK